MSIQWANDQQVPPASQTAQIIPSAPTFQECADIQHVVSLVAPSNAAVLLICSCRERSERLARDIHAKSNRSEKSFIRTRCGLYQGRLLERKFFGSGAGHSRSRFRRLARHPGDVENADGGTLYVEQLQHTTVQIQDALLRLLTGGPCFDPVTGQDCESNVRIIATIPMEIESFVRSGRIHPELGERLSTLTIAVDAPAAVRPPINQGISGSRSFTRSWRSELKSALKNKPASLQPVLFSPAV